MFSHQLFSQKSSVIGVWQSSKYTSASHPAKFYVKAKSLTDLLMLVLFSGETDDVSLQLEPNIKTIVKALFHIFFGFSKIKGG